MPYCPNCGTGFSKGDTYCVNCGTELPDPKNRKQKQPEPEQPPQQNQNRQPTRRQPKQTQKPTQQSNQTDGDRFLAGQLAGAVSGCIVLLSVWLPWMKAEVAGFSTTIPGSEFTMGPIIGFVGIVGAISYLFPKVMAHAFGAICGGSVFILTLLFASDPLAFESDEATELEREIVSAALSSEYGLILCAAASIGLALSVAISYSATS